MITIRTRAARATTGLAIAAVGLLAAACGDSRDHEIMAIRTRSNVNGHMPYHAGEAPIEGSVAEWHVRIDNDEAVAGEVTFRITNMGTIGHEFLVVRTDLAPGLIAVNGDRFAEDDESLLMVDEIPEFPVGETHELTVTLEPGSYQLVCNIAGHYQKGMFTGFTVIG